MNKEALNQILIRHDAEIAELQVRLAVLESKLKRIIEI